MNKMILRESRLTKLLLVVAALTFLAFNAKAQEVKGIQIGMTKQEVQTLYPSGTKWKDGFSVGGIRAKYEISEAVSYEGDKVSSFMYFFGPEDFETMLQAVKTKYPQLKCEDSTVQNGMGAKFTDTTCKYNNLTLTRYVDLKTSALAMRDVEANEKKRAERAKKAASDL